MTFVCRIGYFFINSLEITSYLIYNIFIVLYRGENMSNKLFDIIDSLYEEYLDIWEDICNIESPTNYKAGVDAVGRYFIERAKEHGWRTEVYAQRDSGDVVVITMNPEAKAAPICLSGHMDTVHPVGLFGNPPVRRDTEKIYGPGVTDCKGGLVCALLAMHALESRGYKSRPVMLILQSDEEGGSQASGKDTIRYIAERAKGAVAFLNLEGHSLTEDVLVVERKGILTFEFTVCGKAAHSSLCAVSGANAILEAAYKITELEKLKDHGGLTCSVNMIEGGTAVNTVPEKCVFRANARYSKESEAEWMKSFAEELAKKTYVDGCTTEVKIISYRVAMERKERNLALLSAMNGIFERNGLKPLAPTSATGGSDAADVTAAGVPTVDNLGAEGGRIHSVDEFAVLTSLKKMAKYIAAATAEL